MASGDAEDESVLTPGEDDKEAWRQKDRIDMVFLTLIDYNGAGRKKSRQRAFQIYENSL